MSSLSSNHYTLWVAWVVAGGPLLPFQTGLRLTSAARGVKLFCVCVWVLRGSLTVFLGCYGDWAHRVWPRLAKGCLLISLAVKDSCSEGGPLGMVVQVVYWFAGCLTGTPPPPFLCRRGLLGQLCGQRDGALGLVSGESSIPAF